MIVTPPDSQAMMKKHRLAVEATAQQLLDSEVVTGLPIQPFKPATHNVYSCIVTRLELEAQLVMQYDCEGVPSPTNNFMSYRKRINDDRSAHGLSSSRLWMHSTALQQWSTASEILLPTFSLKGQSRADLQVESLGHEARRFARTLQLLMHTVFECCSVCLLLLHFTIPGLKDSDLP